MGHPPRLAAALLAVAASALLSGCDLDGRFVVNADDTVTVDAWTWEHAETSWTDANGVRVEFTPHPCATPQTYAPGLTFTEVVDPADAARVGCHATGNVPLATLTRTGTVARIGDRIVVLADLRTMQQLQVTSRVTLPDKDSSRLSITFPGSVLSHSGGAAVVGNTVTWSDATVLAWQPLEAVGLAAGVPPDWVVPATVAAASALVGAGCGVPLWRRGARRRGLGDEPGVEDE